MIVASVVMSKIQADRLADLGYGNLVLCKKCGRTERVRVAYCLRTGWPKCCEETMELQKEET